MSQQKPAFGGCVMNRTKFEYSYWDASVFLAYLNNEPNRSDTVQTVLDEIARSRDQQIATSSLTIVEVVTAANCNPPRRITAEQEARIDEILEAPFLRLIDTSRFLYLEARTLMRTALDRGWSLRSKDAVHLATAAWLEREVGNVRSIFSYDTGWPKYRDLVGGLNITVPYVPQPPLPFER